ncbi:hypothetical protein BDN71DRAFT_1514098 [Pleurotus eryngii]|uniref:CxC6 like cysteine cluster associated with KDZ domain-containing protein n=1 Tax=Pleurotus eryngii TaxID=5323 RepID=A0A9P5ZHK8_PLEER|nr:hypothetical protein BDN71DRAFT_1514098 [Pleurotus eryngii]
MACPTLDCNNHSLTQDLRERNIAHVTLLQGSQCLKNNNGDDLCLYLNNAKYLKVGKSVWVNHIVSQAIVNANYSFHASTAAITEFWNFSFVKASEGTFKLGCRQIWKAFVEESIRQMANFNKCQIVFEGNLSINALIATTYIELGDNGVIRSAEGHSCDECCHAFKNVADVISRQPNNPAAVIGHDENHVVPDYEGPALNPDAMEVDNNPAAVVQPAGNIALGNHAEVHIVVIDGIVMGPQHCAMEGCEAGLQNAPTGVFCKKHAEKMKNKSHMKGCGKAKIGDTKACQAGSGVTMYQ